MPELHKTDQSPTTDTRGYATVPDADLTERIRAGAPSAYPATQELRRRHLPAVLSYARLCGANQVAGNQLAAQAFGRAAQAACRGIDPKGTWRHHLLMLVQRVAVGWAGGSRRVRLETGFADWIDENAESSPDRPEPRGLRLEDTSAMLAAFYGLPERTRGALWYGVVEDEPDTETAIYLGIPPDSVAEAKERAQEAMQQAYLQTYLKRSGDRKCQGFRRIIEAAVRPEDRRHSEDLTRHLAECPSCTRVLDDMVRMAEHPRTVLAEGLLGWGGAAYITAGPVPGLPDPETVHADRPPAAGADPAMPGSATPGSAAEPAAATADTLAGMSASAGRPEPDDGTGGREWWTSRPFVLVAVAAAATAAVGAALLTPVSGDGEPTAGSTETTSAPPVTPTPSTSAPAPPPTASSTSKPPPEKKPTPSPSPKPTKTTKAPSRTPSPSKTAEAPPPPRLPGDDFAPVVNASSGLCLDIEYGELENRTDVITAPCTGTPTQLWRVDPIGVVQSYADPDYCLDSRGDTDRGVGIWTCSSVEGENGMNLLFIIGRTGTIRPRIAPDFALTPEAAYPGSDLDLDPAVGRSDQRWTADPATAR
ncbi:ricin-type beta-trefoil lectin domain protein [Streptomyces sp. 8N616]|uniref:ricin-type beta-trefoil lectin domain protein n=1 Tax=Streptomyces sp. 8N616 TaxID=3457414 RepID=UPI003FD01288